MIGARLSLVVASLALLTACGPTRPAATHTAAPEGSPSVDPCVDFARFACAHPGQPAQERAERRLAALRSVLEDAAGAPGDDPHAKLLGDFYAACTDEARIEATGLEPLRALLGKIAKVNNSLSFMLTVGELQSVGVPALFRIVPGADPEDPRRGLVRFTAGAFGLQHREAYLGDAPSDRERLAAYKNHLTRLNELLGQEPGTARDNADDAVRFETALASVVLPDSAREACTKTDLAGLDALQPRLPWRTLLQGADHADLAAVALCSKAELEGIARLLYETRQRTLQTYLRSQLMHFIAPLLGRAFVEEEHAFHVGGELPPRWRACVAHTDAELGDLLGTIYARRELAPDRRAGAEEIARATLAAFAGLARVDSATLVHVGAPARTRDLSSLTADRATFLVNVLEARNLEFKRRMASSGAPLDPEAWPISASATEVRFDPALRELFVPAGLLVAQRFDPAAPAALGYGALGASIGTVLARELAPRLASASATCVSNLAELRGLDAARRAGSKGGQGGDDPRFFAAYAREACDSGASPERINATLALAPDFAKAYRCKSGSPLRAEETCPLW